MNVIKCSRISISLHVNLYECKQSHVSNVMDVRIASISKFFGTLITKYNIPRPLSISKVLVSYVTCFEFYTLTYQIALKF